MIYSKPEFKDLSKEIESTQKKIDSTKDDVLDKKTGKKKKASNLESKLQILQRDLMFMKMKSTVLVTIFMIVTLSSLGNYYDGRPVARLPFVPFSLLSSVTHRGLIGDDTTECSYIFIYILSSFLIRTNLMKILGIETKNEANSMFNPFGLPMPKDT